MQSKSATTHKSPWSLKENSVKTPIQMQVSSFILNACQGGKDRWSTHKASLLLHIEKKSREKKGGVPVRWLICKYSSSKCANWPNSAGMRPGGYKTQSNHTKTSHPILTVSLSTFLRAECKFLSSYWAQVKGEREDGVPVSWFSCKCRCIKFWPNTAGMGPGEPKHSQNIQRTSHPVRLLR
jgi:hypothetical protein